MIRMDQNDLIDVDSMGIPGTKKTATTIDNWMTWQVVEPAPTTPWSTLQWKEVGRLEV